MLKTKTNINITIDTNIYIKAKMKENFNLSGECNEFLKKRLGDTETIKQLEIDKEKKIRELEYLEMETIRLKQLEAKAKEQEINKAKEQQKADLERIPIGNDFQSKLAREKLFKIEPELKKTWENATSAAK